MNEITINAEDLKLIRKFQDIMNRGYYASGQEVVTLYNRVLNKRANPSNCSACIRRQIQELVDAADRFERLSQRLSEAQTEEQVDNIPQEENKPVRTKKKK